MKLFKSRLDLTKSNSATDTSSGSFWDRMKAKLERKTNERGSSNNVLLYPLAIIGFLTPAFIVGYPMYVDFYRGPNARIKYEDAALAITNAERSTICRSNQFLGMTNSLIDLGLANTFQPRPGFRPVSVEKGPDGTVVFSAIYHIWPSPDIVATVSKKVKVPTCD